MIQPDMGKRRKGPPKFRHLPKPKAKQLKYAWIQTRKIKSKWNAEKRRMESLSTAPTLEIGSNGSGAAGQTLDHQPEFIDVDTGSDASPSLSKEHPAEAPSSRTIREPARTSKMGPTEGSSQQKDRRSGRPSGSHGKKPSMRNRMNALLEKIQRDID